MSELTRVPITSANGSTNFKAFLYLLLRDYLLVGDLNKITKEIVRLDSPDIEYTDKLLEHLAERTMERLGNQGSK
jgi:hypothetical protein